MEILFEIVAYPFFSLLSALAGIVWPTDDPDLRRLQRICLATLVGGLSVLLAAIVGAFCLPAGGTMVLLVVAGLVLIAAGEIGGHIEGRCLGAKPSEPSSDRRCKIE
jgi:hypothetical protein